MYRVIVNLLKQYYCSYHNFGIDILSNFNVPEAGLCREGVCVKPVEQPLVIAHTRVHIL